MFNRHLIINNGREENLYLYINNYYEFSEELLNCKIRRNTLFDMIYKYIVLKSIKFEGNKIFLVFNGLVIGYVLTKDVYLNNPRDIIHYEYVDKIRNYNNVDKTESIPELIDDYVTFNFNNI